MTISELLAKGGQSESAALREHLIMIGMAKLSRYEAECSFFKNKYQETLASFKGKLSKEGQEDFVMEDDMLDWEFADAALKWWRSQLEELKSAA